MCYAASEDVIIGYSTLNDVIKKAYIPAFLPEIQVQMQDIVALTAALYVDCSIDKFFI